MTIKEITNLYHGLEKRISNLETSITNHCGQHAWDRVVSYAQLTLMVLVILLLKFKIL